MGAESSENKYIFVENVETFIGCTETQADVCDASTQSLQSYEWRRTSTSHCG